MTNTTKNLISAIHNRQINLQEKKYNLSVLFELIKTPQILGYINLKRDILNKKNQYASNPKHTYEKDILREEILKLFKSIQLVQEDIITKTFSKEINLIFKQSLSKTSNLSNKIFSLKNKKLKKKKLFYKWKISSTKEIILSYLLKKQKSLYYVHINILGRNTIVTLTDKLGNVIIRSTAGSVQKGAFKRGMKSKFYTAKTVGEEVAKKAAKLKIKNVLVRLKGAGKKRKAAVKPFEKFKVRVFLIEDLTSLPHNGCREKHRPRK